MKPIVTFDEFSKIDMRIGKVITAEEKEGSEKLLRLIVDFGPDEEKHTILTGVKQWYTPEDLIGKKFLFIINLQPRKMMGEDSEGMILMADGEKPIALIPQEDTPEGASIR